MDEDCETLVNLPTFISNAIKQLISLKDILSEEIILYANEKQVEKSDLCNYANKVKECLQKIKTSVENIDVTFGKTYEDFKKTWEYRNRVSVIHNNTSHPSTIADSTIDKESDSNTSESLIPDKEADKKETPKSKTNVTSAEKNDETTSFADDKCKNTNTTIEDPDPHNQSLTDITTEEPENHLKEPSPVPENEESEASTHLSDFRNDDSENDASETDAEKGKTEKTAEAKDDSKEVDKIEDENEPDDKPKVGFIKCIDITKLLDPKIKESRDTTDNCKTKIDRSSNNTIVLLSSSESEQEKLVKRNNKQNKKEKVKRAAKSKRNKKDVSDSDEDLMKYICNRKNNGYDSDSDTVTSRRTRGSARQKNVNNKKSLFAEYKQTRNIKLRKKVILESSDSEDNSSVSDESTCKSKNLNTVKNSITKNRTISDSYDYKNDSKFKCECYVSLLRVATENLKEYYLEELQDKQINRLTDMKSLKRSRPGRASSSSSSSDSAIKNVKKRTKLQTPTNAEAPSDSDSDIDDPKVDEQPVFDSNNQDHDENGADIIADQLRVSSNEEEDDKEKESESTDEKKKEKPKKKDKIEANNQNENEGEEANKEDKEEPEKENKKNSDASDSDDETSDKKKNGKWRTDKLLRGKLSATDSEDELIRFRNKKHKMEKDIRSGTEEEIVIPKKSNTKKTLKRIKRRLGSDSNSSSDSDNNGSGEEESKQNNDSSSNSSNSDSDSDKKKKKTVRKRIKRLKDSEDSSDNAAKKKEEDEEQSTRKKIRNVWNRDSLAETTKQAAKEEEERKKRIAERQKLYNHMFVSNLEENSKVDKIVLDFNDETQEELLSVHPDLVAKLKPHQANGVQFMWTACFESLERAKNTPGSGCILAHCMGLGKTLQVITLIHTLLLNANKTNIRTALIVCPLSTVLNWVSEFKKWLDDLDGDQVNVFDLVAYKQNYERLYQMQDWMKMGGVMIMGYDMFRNLSNPKGKRMSKKLVNGFGKCLLEPGPDLVVCDEGHLLKNEKTGISIAMNRLKTKRRIVLTGTPLQNNLKEYFCMVQFVKPNLLGTYKEYLNRFVNPITNGQYTDSTPHDIYIMRKRAHVLHKMLDAVVERRDYNVLAPFLPPKHEFVLFVSLTKVQCDLYKEYLSKYARDTSVKGTSYLFQDFQELQRICIHPRVLLDKSNQDKLRKEIDDESDSLKNFIDDDSEKSTTSAASSSDSDSDKSDKQVVAKRRTRANPGHISEEEPEVVPQNDAWWSKFCNDDELDNICHSSKLILLFDILKQCEAIGDKVLVFSQSLFSLNLIEYFLARIDEATQTGQNADMLCGHSGSWALGLDYFRMDGSTSCDNRANWCKSFNNENNTRARLFLISTRAGGLGINLVAANRVIIFDVSWNPSYDIQSIYRVYRFGQTKPCYVYRFVTLGTMENKIYERQVTKQAISKRVIDEQQIDRHYNQHDLAELYAFNPVPDEERPTPLVPKDRLFADLLQAHDKEIFKYHEHNSLLENKADEGLNEEERRAAWEEFENEKKAPTFNLMQAMVKNGMYETLRIVVQQDNSTWTPAQVNNVLPTIVQRISEQVAKGDFSMYRRIEEKHEIRVLEQRKMQFLYQQYMQQLRNAGNPSLMNFDPAKFSQFFNSFNQNVGGQPASSSTGAFTQSTPAPPTTPIITDIVELND